MTNKTPEELEQEKINDLFRERIEFRQFISRMTEIYVDKIDEDGIRPTVEWFIKFINNNELD